MQTFLKSIVRYGVSQRQYRNIERYGPTKQTRQQLNNYLANSWIVVHNQKTYRRMSQAISIFSRTAQDPHVISTGCFRSHLVMSLLHCMFRWTHPPFDNWHGLHWHRGLSLIIVDDFCPDRRNFCKRFGCHDDQWPMSTRVWTEMAWRAQVQMRQIHCKKAVGLKTFWRKKLILM